MAIFALGILPYITAFIILQLIATISPMLERLKREGEVGRKIINQYTRYLTVALAAIQAYGIAIGLESWRSAFGPLVIDPGWMFRVTTVATLVGGTIFLMWLGEQVTSRGIGNGALLIILAGIWRSRLLRSRACSNSAVRGRFQPELVLVVLVATVFLMAFIVFMERAQRRLIVQYSGHRARNQMFVRQSRSR